MEGQDLVLMVLPDSSAGSACMMTRYYSMYLSSCYYVCVGMLRHTGPSGLVSMVLSLLIYEAVSCYLVP